jgi:hypothetical protein
MTKTLSNLIYDNLTIEELGQSNIPDENLFFVVTIGNSPKDFKYLFYFKPKFKSPDGYLSVNEIKIEAERVLTFEKPRKYEKNSSDILEVLDGFQKTVKGKRESLKNSSHSSFDSYRIKEPEAEMTQKGIAELVKNIENELKFSKVNIFITLFQSVTPPEPYSENLGFNLPAQKISGKIWKK